MRIYCQNKNDKKEFFLNGDVPGSVHMIILSVLMIVFVTAGGYIYSVNRNAIQGYHLRSLEKEMSMLKQQNAELRITEMDLRSLNLIETSEETLRMQKIDTAVYIEEFDHNDSRFSRSVALK